MNKTETVDVNQIVANSFGLLKVPDEFSVEDCEYWDSLAHVGILVALSEEIELPEDEFIQAAIDAHSVREIKEVLKKFGVPCK